jgi:hypothetical protein
MIDRNGTEIKIGDRVKWQIGLSHAPRAPHQGSVVAIVPKGEDVPHHLITGVSHKKFLLYTNGIMTLNSTIDRVFVAENRLRSCPRLYCPRPSSVEVIGDW